MVAKLATGSWFSSCSCWCAITLLKIPANVFPTPAQRSRAPPQAKGRKGKALPSVPSKGMFEENSGVSRWVS